MFSGGRFGNEENRDHRRSRRRDGKELPFDDVTHPKRCDGRSNVVFAGGRAECFPRRKVQYATVHDPHNHHTGPW